MDFDGSDGYSNTPVASSKLIYHAKPEEMAETLCGDFGGNWFLVWYFKDLSEANKCPACAWAIEKYGYEKVFRSK